MIPDYEGSDDYRCIPAAAVRGQVSGISFSTRGTYLYVDVIPRGTGKLDFDAGPIVGRAIRQPSPHRGSTIVDLLPDRKTPIEVGGFAGISFHGLTNPYDSLSLHLDVRPRRRQCAQVDDVQPELAFSTPAVAHDLRQRIARRRIRRQQICRLLFQHHARGFARDGRRPAGVQRRRRNEGLEAGPARSTSR